MSKNYLFLIGIPWFIEYLGRHRKWLHRNQETSYFVRDKSLPEA